MDNVENDCPGISLSLNVEEAKVDRVKHDWKGFEEDEEEHQIMHLVHLEKNPQFLSRFSSGFEIIGSHCLNWRSSKYDVQYSLQYSYWPIQTMRAKDFEAWFISPNRRVFLTQNHEPNERSNEKKKGHNAIDL